MPGHGSRHKLRLSSAYLLCRAPRRGTSGKGLLRMGTRVLLAEDEPLIACSFADLLEAEGYEVDLASDGAEALGVAQGIGDALGALVTDLRMPRMRGEDLIRALRAERPGLPVVVVTGSAPPGGVDSLRRGAGGDGPVLLLHKPADGGQLAAAPRSAVAGGAARPAAADRVEVADLAPASDVAVAADDPTTDYAGSFFSTGVFTFGPGLRPAACVHDRDGDDAFVRGPGEAAWMVGGTENHTHEGDTAAAAHPGGDRVALFFGHQAAERPDEGRGAVRAGVDLAPPSREEAPVLAAGARREVGNAVSNLLVGGGGDDLVAGLGGGGGTYRLDVRGDLGVWGASGTAEAWLPPRWT